MPLTHRLVSQIEETPAVGSGNWNKVTVLVPNNTYVLSKVELENNQLSVVFDFSDVSTYDPVPFPFLLSGFGIDTSLITDDTNYLVVGVQNPTEQERRDSKNSSNSAWFSNQNYLQYIQQLGNQENSMRAADNKCPHICPLS